MSEASTPITEEIRWEYSNDPHIEVGETYTQKEAEFDRWLSAHDAEISDNWRSLHRIHQETEAELMEAIHHHGERIKASEARVAELQAVIAAVREWDDRTGYGWADTLEPILSTTPSDVLAAHDAQVKADAIKEAAAVLHSSDRVWAHRAAIWLLGSYSEVRGTGTPNGESK